MLFYKKIYSSDQSEDSEASEENAAEDLADGETKMTEEIAESEEQKATSIYGKEHDTTSHPIIETALVTP